MKLRGTDCSCVTNLRALLRVGNIPRSLMDFLIKRFLAAALSISEVIDYRPSELLSTSELFRNVKIKSPVKNSF